MNLRPVQFEVIGQFKGMASDCDPEDCPPETLYRQVNLMSITDGILTTRGGLKELTLDILE